MPTANEPKTHSAWLTYPAMLGFILLVSSSPAVTRLGVRRTLTPYDLMVMRCGIGALIFLPYFFTQLRRMPRRLPTLPPWARASSLWAAFWAWLFYRDRSASC